MRPINALIAVSMAALVLIAHPSAQAPAASPAVPGQIIVKFRPGASAAAKADVHRQGRGGMLREIARSGVQLVTVAAGDEAEAINRYRRNPNVLYAERNVIRRIPAPVRGARLADHGPGAELVPGDHLFGEQWALHNTGQPFYCFAWIGEDLCFYIGTADADIDAPEGWALTAGTGITVAVIDTGIDYTHPDLAANYAGGYNFVNPVASPMDDHGHGTHVAGTIAAALNNLTGNPADEEGIVGVAPHARLLAYKVCDAGGYCNDFDVELAIDRAIADGAKVINMSLGGSEYTESLNEAVQDAWNAGIVIVAGAGNDGTTDLFYPAALEHVLSVGAFDEEGHRASFSNYGPWVDISAPGNVIMSSYPMSSCAAENVPGDTGCYTWLSGTSMATPHVSGAAALVWSRSDVTTNQQVVDILLESADPQGVSTERLDSWTIHGGLNIHDALSHGAEPSGAQTVRVTASIAQATEAGLTAGAFTISRSGDTSEGLVVNISVGGTATPGSDYVELPGTIAFEPGSSSVTVPVTPLDDTLFENDESVTLTIAAGAGYTVGNPASGIVTIVSDELPPDLTVSSLTTPSTAAPDTDITITDGTRNLGTGASTSSSTGFYLSTNSTLDASDTFLASRPVPALAAGATSALSTTLHIPANQAAGSYFVIAKADWDSAIPEKSETNNVRPSGVITIGPDLLVTALTAPATAAAGVSFTVSETTKNQGAGSAGGSTTRFYLSTNTSLDAADTEIGARAVPPLSGGASNQVTNTALTVPASTATGTYYVIAQADATSAVPETSETNNTRVSGALKIGPDLTVSALTVPSLAAAGGSITVTDTTKNMSSGPVPSSSTGFYLSTNSVLDAADTYLGKRTVGALPANGSESASTTLQIPSGLASGTYYVLARADYDETIPETTETNNDKFGSTVIGGDLVLTAAATSPTGTAGGSMTITDTTRNQGGAPVPQSSTGFYLSVNSSYNPGDVFLGSRTVSALAASTSEGASTQVAIPANTAPGTYFVIAIADWNGSVSESSETNNTRATGTIRIGPDLVVNSLNAPTTAVAGTTIAGSDTTMNQGGETAPATVTSIYLSANSTIDAGDQVIGTRQVSAVGAGLSSTGAVSLTIPASTPPGTYYIIAKADCTDSVPEISETNNTRARTITISAAP
jgi:subtilisin family serine protease/subtilase family serine protease